MSLDKTAKDSTPMATAQNYFDVLAKRILYQLERQGLIKAQGRTVDEINANIKRAQEITAAMILESRP